jgi:hypothetical protein
MGAIFRLRAAATAPQHLARGADKASSPIAHGPREALVTMCEFRRVPNVPRQV